MIRIILPIAFLLSLFMWTPVLAAEATFFGPIVPPECNCDAEGISSAPDWGCVMQTIQNAINFTISMSVIIATIFIIYTGFMFVASAGNPHTREAAKTRLVNVVVGMLVVLAAWLIVDFIMKTLYNEGEFGPWNAILQNDGAELCFQPREAPPPLPGVTANPGNWTGTGGGTNLTGAQNCPDCVSLSALGLTCKSSNSCTADPRVAPRLVDLETRFAGSWRITEAYPPTVAHTNACHRQGTCVDAGFTGSTSYSVDNVRAFVQAANAAGFRAVFETSSCSLRDSVRAAGIQDAFCSGDRGYGHITGNHFSLYARSN